MNQPHFQLLSRKDCCLCEDAKEVVGEFAQRGECTWDIVDVDRDKALLVRYGLDVPVLMADGEVLCRHQVSAAALQNFLAGQAAAGGSL